jgi:hypothetical protein
MIRPWKRAAAVLVLVVLLAGCGGRGNVSGTVKFDGQPLSGGTITFYDSRNGSQSSAIGKDGAYSVSGLAAGPVKVSLAVPLPISFVARSMPGGGEPTPPPVQAPPLPAKYLDASTSELGFELARGDQKKNFDLPR